MDFQDTFQLVCDCDFMRNYYCNSFKETAVIKVHRVNLVDRENKRGYLLRKTVLFKSALPS